RVFQIITEAVLHELNAERVTLVTLDDDGQELMVTTSAAGDAGTVTTTGQADGARHSAAKSPASWRVAPQDLLRTDGLADATADLRDHPTREHSNRAVQYALAIGSRMGLSADRLEDLKTAALLHDIGKIGIGDGVLRKPGHLTAEEYDGMKTHTLMGAKILAM